MDITQLLGGDLGKQVIAGISQKTQTTEQETSSVIQTATPVLLGMLKKNAETKTGASNLLGALNEHDGSILNNLGNFFGQENTSDGQGILDHILGGKKKTVEQSISTQTGIDASKVTHILALLAPIIMGKLGSQAQSSSGGIGDLLGNLMSGMDSSSAGGNILSSVLGQATGKGSSKKGGLGSSLGGFFKS